LKGAAAPKRSPGRPRKTPSPQRNGENGLARCAICSGPHRKHLLQQGRRVGLADQTLSAAACDAAQVAHGTYACGNCKKAMEKRARAQAAEAARAAEAAQVAQLTPERLQSIDRVLSAPAL